MRKSMRYFCMFLLAVLFVVGGIGANFANKTTQTHTVLSVDKIQETEGDSENFYTRVYYLVSTDKGAYHVRTKGLNAAPQCVGIQKDSTYVLTTRGVNIPILGVYPCIINVRK